MSDNSRAATLKVRAEVFSLTSSLMLHHYEHKNGGRERIGSPDLHEALEDLFLKVRFYGKIIMSRFDIRW